MEKIRRILAGLPELIPFSCAVVKLGISLFAGYIFIAAAMHIISFSADYYMNARVIFNGAIESGAGCLASAVTSALLCDVIYKRDIAGR